MHVTRGLSRPRHPPPTRPAHPCGSAGAPCWAARVPVGVLGPQQPQAAPVGKHVFILDEEAVGAQGSEQGEDLEETDASSEHLNRRPQTRGPDPSFWPRGTEPVWISPGNWPPGTRALCDAASNSSVVTVHLTQEGGDARHGTAAAVWCHSWEGAGQAGSPAPQPGPSGAGLGRGSVVNAGGCPTVLMHPAPGPPCLSQPASQRTRGPVLQDWRASPPSTVHRQQTSSWPGTLAGWALREGLPAGAQKSSPPPDKGCAAWVAAALLLMLPSKAAPHELGDVVKRAGWKENALGKFRKWVMAERWQTGTRAAHAHQGHLTVTGSSSFLGSFAPGLPVAVGLSGTCVGGGGILGAVGGWQAKPGLRAPPGGIRTCVWTRGWAGCRQQW